MPALAEAPEVEVAYLGPEGSFAHLVAQQRFPGSVLTPCRTVPEVFDYVEEHAGFKGIVPIENSSGGMIVPTIDGIIEHACELFIEEELSINVQLALLARSAGEVRRIYSHFAPLHHCGDYLKEHYPNALAVPCDSTSAAAQAAAAEEGAAAIATYASAEKYGLQVIAFPLRKEVPNITQFFVVGHVKREVATSEKTSLVVALESHAGSLYEFLKPFAEARVNLTRIESRPIAGQPNTYRFLVELQGTEDDAAVQLAFQGAEKVAAQFYNVGSYPVIPRFQS